VGVFGECGDEVGCVLAEADGSGGDREWGGEAELEEEEKGQ